jgi:outer membrane immunogenic protein
MRSNYPSVIALSLALFAGSALAADLPSRKAPAYLPPPPLQMWTGFYVGLNAGGAWGANNAINMLSAPTGTNPNGSAGDILTAWAIPSTVSESGILGGGNSGGFIGGGQIGYNWQFSNIFVAGIEADIQGVAGSDGTTTGFGVASVAGGSSSAGLPISTNLSASKRLDYLGTVRGRIGYLVAPSLLAYVTGGLAYGGVNLKSSAASFAPGIDVLSGLSAAWGSAGGFSDTRAGWTVGGGLEWMFLPNWSAKVEYLYYDLGNISYVHNPTGSIVLRGANIGTPWWLNTTAVSSRFDGHIARAGVNYHFNWGAPAQTVANY